MSDNVSRLNAALEGRYRIESELGEGGMATVYLADDIKHERKVALKVLKQELAAAVGAERFLAEIKTTANLQHPHILPLFDSGEADSFLFYVMPYVEGETLRDKLDRDHQLAVDDAVRISSAVGNALDYAHRQGVIHRDIKPSNILIHDGQPVISDFGIALAVGTAGQGRLTETGLSLGTPHYMSPEQATGDLSVGASTDVYALGCVLYEMLIGEPPYTGSTAQAILGKIITEPPASVTKLRKTVPANVEATVSKALEKVPADRFRSGANFANALSDPGFRHGEEEIGEVAAGAGLWKRLTLGTAALACALTIALAWSLFRPEPPQPVERFGSLFEEGQWPVSFGGAGFNISPDGSFLVYRGPGGQLWLRRWASLDATPIPGTEGASGPTFSPDGRELAFEQDLEIKVMALDGGQIRPLMGGEGPHWGPDGFIYAKIDAGLVRVPAAGGSPELVGPLEEGEVAIWIEDFLPGGEALLMDVEIDGGASVVQVLNLATGERAHVTTGSFPRYLASGHLTFLTVDGALMAAPFDLKAMEMIGLPVVVVDSVTAYVLSNTGKLVYSAGVDQLAALYTPVWVDREGGSREVDVGWRVRAHRSYSSLSLSPSGGRLAVSYGGAFRSSDLWVTEVETGALTKLTTDGDGNRRASWSLDGQSLLFASSRGNPAGSLWSMPADGSAEAELVFDDERGIGQGEYTPNGEWLVYRVATSSNGGNSDIYAIRLGVDSAGIPLLDSEFQEMALSLSPDGAWIAYVSDRTGSYEVYVRPFPDVESAVWVVSLGGGTEPLWSRGDSELFYRSEAGELVAAKFSASEERFLVTDRVPLFPLEGYLTSGGGRMYDVAPDGRSFVMFAEDQAARRHIILVNNFFEDMRESLRN